MKLLKISMRGFKSFADRTDLQFHDGTTVIVGPNGSGKSNISDALRWVLGETSARNLRGNKMEDIIYVGSESRRGLGFAEVEMILDNTDQTLPIEYSEVSISRRLYKSGESEYAINHCACRAKDIRELFMDTGVGRDGYSIIGQGRIDSILSDKPEDRRSIFEEVAGIVKYRNQKNESERKLEKTNDNLIRISDLLTELHYNYEEMHQQAEKTRKYHALYDELKELDIAHAKNDLHIHFQVKQQNHTALKQVETELKQNEAERSAIQNKIEKMKEDVQYGETQLDEFESVISRTSTTHTELKSEVELSQSRLFFLEKDIRRMEAELLEMSVKQQEEENMLLLLQQDYREIDQKRELLEHQHTDQERDLEEQKLTIDDLKVKVENLKTENSNLMLRREGLTQRYQYLQTEQATLLAETTQGKKFDAERETRQSFLRSEMAMLEGQLQQTDQKISHMKVVLTQKKQKRERLQSECKETELQMHDLELEIGKKESEEKALSVLEDSFEGYQKPVKEVMKHFLHEKEGQGIRGTLSEVFHVDSPYLEAIEVSLGSALQFVVIEREFQIQPLINFLKERKLGRVTFLPLDGIRQNHFKRWDLKNIFGVVDYADRLIHCEDTYRELFAGLLSNTLIVESMDIALHLDIRLRSSHKIVTLDGELFHNRGSVTGGSLGTKVSGILHRRSKIEELKNQIAVNSEKFSELSSLLEIRLQSLNHLSLEIDTITEEIMKCESERHQISLKYHDTEKEWTELLRDIEGSRHTQEEEEKKYKELVLSIQKTEQDITDIESQLSSNKNEMKKYAEDLFQKENALNEEVTLFNNNYVQLVNLRNRISNLSEKETRTQILIEEIQKKRNEKMTDLQKERNEEMSLKDKLSILDHEITLSSAQVRDYLQKKEKEKSVLDQLRQDYYRAQEILAENNACYASLERKKANIEVKLAKSEVQVENIISRILSDYNVLLDAKADTGQNPISGQYQTRIMQLKDDISKLGSVNTNAVEEERKLGERLEFMTNQEQDLRFAKSDLETVIQNIEEKMGVLFQEAIDTVARNFSKVYTQFFGGGTAELKLSHPEDPLNSGIEILLTPPGKKMQAISLLSGGEKALTAIALLFAIQKIKPSPFCILDEIDAALDEVNIDRFTGYLRASLDEVQFIIITHRKRTMEIGDSLYGISMGEDGVSSVLSVHLKDKKIS